MDGRMSILEGSKYRCVTCPRQLRCSLSSAHDFGFKFHITTEQGNYICKNNSKISTISKFEIHFSATINAFLMHFILLNAILEPLLGEEKFFLLHSIFPRIWNVNPILHSKVHKMECSANSLLLFESKKE